MGEFRPLFGDDNQPAEPVSSAPHVYAGKDIDPVAAGKALKASATDGVPADIALRNPTQYGAFKPLDWSTIDASPALKKAAVDPLRAAIVQNDTQLPFVETLIQSMSPAGLKRQVQEIVQPLSDLGRSMASGPSRFASGVYGEGRVISQALGLSSVADSMRYASEATKATAGNIQGDISSRPHAVQVALGGAQSLGEQAPFMALGIARAGATAADRVFNQAYSAWSQWRAAAIPAGALGVATGGEAGSEALDKGLDPFSALNYSVTQGGSEFAFEMLPGLKFIEDMKAGSSFLKTFARNQALEQPSEVATTLFQNLDEWATLHPEKTVGDFLAEQPQAIADTMLATLFQGAVQTGGFKLAGSIAQSRQDATEAAAYHDHFVKVGNVLKATETATRSPELLAQIVQDMSETHGTPQKLYIDSADLGEALNQSGLTLSEFTDLMPASKESILKAFSTQSTIELPVGETLVNLPKSPVWGALNQKVRTSEEGFHPDEAKAFLQSSYNAHLQSEADKVLASSAVNDEFKASAKEVHAIEVKRLVESGRMKPADAQENAKLTEAWVTTLAHDWHESDPTMTPLKMYQQLFGDAPSVIPSGAVTYSGGLNQPADGGANRGAYYPMTGQIQLLAQSDASTFIHESAHRFLDLTAKMALMADAPMAVKARADAALKAIGIEPAGDVSRSGVWESMTLEDQRHHHELFAETFERYMFTGKAPSLELAGAFRSFKKFMLRAYETLKAFLAKHPGIKPNKELFAVFDSMLATEEQIAEAGRAKSIVPLLSEKPAAMSEKSWRDYLSSFEESSDEAAETLDARRLRDMQYTRNLSGKLMRELAKDNAALRAEMRIEARRNVLQKPIYRAWSFLHAKMEEGDKIVIPSGKSGKDLDVTRDSLFVAIAKLGGLNHKEAASEGWIDSSEGVRSPVPAFGKPLWRKSGGVSIDDMGEMLMEFGYLSADRHGKYDRREFEEAFSSEDRGGLHYSYEFDYARQEIIDGKPGEFVDVSTLNAGRFDFYELSAMPNLDKDIRDALIARRMTAKSGGLHPDIVSEMFGFNTASAFLEELAYTTPPDRAIEHEVDRLMMERHGDINSPEAMRDAVDAAVMNAVSVRIMATELNAINRTMGSVTATVNAAREAAKGIIYNLTVGNLRPSLYSVTVGRAGKAAEQALAKGDHAGVVAAKRAQVLNAELARLAANEKADIQSALAEVRSKWFKPNGDIAKTRDMNFVFVARNIAASYGMVTEKRTQETLKMLATIAEYDKDGAALIQSMVADLPDAKPYADLTVDEFQQVMTVARSAWNLAKGERKFVLDEKKGEIDDLEKEVIDAIGNSEAIPAALKGTISFKDKAGNMFNGWRAALRRPEAFFELCGLDAVLFRPLSNAVTAHKLMREDVVSKYLSILSEHKIDTTPIEAPDLFKYGKNNTPYVFKRGKAELLHALLHTGNDSNKRKLLLGMGWAEKNGDGSLNTDRWDSFIRRMIDKGIITKADYDLCQSVWDLMEEMKPAAQKTHKELFGHYFNEITANPVVTPFGIYRGGYVPAVYDKRSPAVAARIKEDEILNSGTNSSTFPSTGRGFSKDRTEFHDPMELNLELLPMHLDSVSRFINIEPTIRTLAKLFNRPAVQVALESYAPGVNENLIRPWLTRAARQTVSTPSIKVIDTAINWLNERASRSIMMANIANTAQQLTGTLLATAKVNAPAMARALFLSTHSPIEARDYVVSKSPFMKVRINSSSFDMQAQLERIVLGKGMFDSAVKADAWVKQHAYFMQSFAQNRVDVVVWIAAHDEATAKGSADPVGDADSAVRMTQGSFNPEDMASIEAGTAPWRAMMKFYSYFGMLGNLMANESAKAKTAGVKGIPHAAYAWLVAFGVTNMLANLIAVGLPDDPEDEDTVLTRVFMSYLTSFGSGVAAMVPAFGGAAVAAVKMADDKPFNDRLAVAPVVSFSEKFLKGLHAATNPDTYDDDMKSQEVRALLAFVGIAVPTGQVSKTAGYMIDMQNGVQQPESVVDEMLGLARGR